MTKGNTDKLAQKGNCQLCGKPTQSESRAGSLTSYLFQSSNCQCGRKDNAQRPGQNDSGKSRDYCEKCGLKNRGGERAGSITGFLFQDIRCKCSPIPNFGAGIMSEKLWKLKQAEMGSTFSSDSPVESATPNTARRPVVEARDSSTESRRTKQSKPTVQSIGLAKGAIIGGVYRIIDLIGRGGMGEVYLTEHITLGKKCALKVIPPEQVTEIGWLRFQAEARAVAKLDHINLVKVNDLGIHEGCLPFYAMEYVSGKTMSELLHTQGAMPLSVAIDIFSQICDGLDYSHRNSIIHRDLKPANIMLSKTGDGKISVKVLDFGLVKLTQRDRHKQSLTSVGEIMGSPFYMSPEQCDGSKIDQRSDIYSLGCNLFECLTGRPPFDQELATTIMRSHIRAEAPSLESVVGQGVYPESIEVLSAKLLRKNPVERYQTMKEVRGDLQRVANGESVQPFYVSRGNRAASIDLSRDRDSNLSAEYATQSGHEGSVDLSLLSSTRHGVILSVCRQLCVVLTLAVALALGIRAYHSTGPGNSQQQKTSIEPLLRTKADQIVIRKESIKLSPRSLQNKQPFTTMVTRNGKKLIQYDFPTDITIGSIGLLHKKLQPATGRLTFPCDQFIEFIPMLSLDDYPTYLDRFQRGDVECIKISNLGDNGLLQKCAVLPGVHQLEIQSTKPSNRHIRHDIDKFQSLTDLIVDENSISAVDVTKLSALRKLRTLDLLGYNTVDPILTKLSGSPELEIFCTDARITKNGLANIVTFPYLKYLQFPFDNRLSVQDIRILSRLPNLTNLTMYNWPLDKQSVEVLKSLKWLESLSLPDTRLSQEGFNYLQAQLPGVRIYTRRQQQN